MQKYVITVEQTADKLSDGEDELHNPQGVYYETADTEDEALDEFHSRVPIGCLEDFDITIEKYEPIPKHYKVWIEVEEYNPETDEYSKGLQLDAGEFETETEANQYASKLFEGN